MMKTLMTATFALAALVAGCGKKTEPKSVSTTSTKTTTQDNTGESTATESKTTTTEMPDGSKSVETTQKTNSSAPATAPNK